MLLGIMLQMQNLIQEIKMIEDKISNEIYLLEDIKNSQELNQGDIIFWPQETDDLKKFGIVVTGDCDIANEKCWGKISVVPFFSMQYYLEHFACVKRLNKICTKVYNILINELKSKNLSYSEEEIDLYLLQLDIDDSITETADTCIKVLKHIKGIKKEFLSNLEALRAAHKITNTDKFKENLQNELNNPADEFFYLGELQTQILPQQNDFPAIAWLRIIREVNISEIALTRAPQIPRLGARIARLAPVFRYGLTQRLGEIFSSIGLPDEHAAKKKEHINNVIHSIED